MSPASVMQFRMSVLGGTLVLSPWTLDLVLMSYFLDRLLGWTAQALDLNRRLFLQHLLAIEPLHLHVVTDFVGRHVRLLPRRQLLLASVLGHAQIVEIVLHPGR